MKEISQLTFPEELRYTDEHEWVRLEGNKAVVGITDYAQDQLGDIVFVEMPEVGQSLAKGAEFGTLESVKAVSEMYMPVGGKVLAVNTALEDGPEAVNNDPYGSGWIIEVQADDPSEAEGLMTSDQYVSFLKG
jgi:glycine cleavage system H protein